MPRPGVWVTNHASRGLSGMLSDLSMRRLLVLGSTVIAIALGVRAAAEAIAGPVHSTNGRAGLLV